jgi:hypothetical protein
LHKHEKNDARSPTNKESKFQKYLPGVRKKKDDSQVVYIYCSFNKDAKSGKYLLHLEKKGNDYLTDLYSVFNNVT